MSLSGRIPYPGSSGPPTEVTSNNSPPRSEVSLSSLLHEYRINAVSAQSQGYSRAQSILKSGARRRRNVLPDEAAPQLNNAEVVPADLPSAGTAPVVPPIVIKTPGNGHADRKIGRERNYLDERKVASVLGIPEEEATDAEDRLRMVTIQAEIHHMYVSQIFPMSSVLNEDVAPVNKEPDETVCVADPELIPGEDSSFVDGVTEEMEPIVENSSVSASARSDGTVSRMPSDASTARPTAKVENNGQPGDWRVALGSLKDFLTKMRSEVDDFEPRSLNRQTSAQTQSRDSASISRMSTSASASNLDKTDSRSGRPRKEDPGDSFFGSLFEDKVPKVQLDAALKRLNTAEKENMRLLVDMKRFKEQQSAQLKVLTKQLDSVLKPLVLEDNSLPSPSFGTKGSTDSPTARSRFFTPGEKPVDLSSLEMSLMELVRRLQKDQEHLMETIKEIQSVGAEDRKKLSVVVEDLQDKLQQDKLVQKITVNNLEEILRKLTSLERTQAMLAEQAWRH